jgi:hypothetical protein
MQQMDFPRKGKSPAPPEALGANIPPKTSATQTLGYLPLFLVIMSTK